MELVSLLTSTTDKGGGVNPNAWDISKAYYDAGADAWDIGGAFYTNISAGVAAQDTSVSGLFFKPDGTKMYITGGIGDAVYEYSLSTAWLVSSKSYVQSFSISAQENDPEAVFFKPDGTKMYVLGNNGDDVNEYSLSSAWDISTASYVQNFSVATEENAPRGMFFKPDGTKMYICGSTGDDVNEYSLSSAWDISTASYVQNFSVATQELAPRGLFFKPDGLKLFIVGSGSDQVNEYDLSSAWDISTASHVQSFSVLSQDSVPTDLFFHPDGTGFYVLGDTIDFVFQYIIGGFSVATEETSPSAFTFKPDGTKMYVLGTVGDDVNEYDLSTAWDITTASYVQNFSVASQETLPQAIQFKPDGTKMYILGFTTADVVNEYSLSSAWDITSASYVRNFSVAAQDIEPRGLFFKPDGTKMYVTGSEGSDVNEYNLSTAWNVSSASYLQNKSVSAQDTNPRGIFFKPDGTKMYIVGFDSDDVNEYSLSSAWDVTSASFVQVFSLTLTGETSPRDIFWKDDGTQFWTIGLGTDRVFSFLISPT
jgi:DNA-binding beta-propeller fold protein YncE